MKPNRKYILVILAILSAVWIFYAIAFNKTSKYKEFNNFSWLVGNWVMKGEDYTVYETWDELGEVVLEGRSATLSKSGDTLSREELRILKIDDKFYYLAKPNNKPRPTMFKMTLDSIYKVVFYNPDNYFPKWIIYEKKGDSLFATIRDEKKKIVFAYEKE